MLRLKLLILSLFLSDLGYSTAYKITYSNNLNQKQPKTESSYCTLDFNDTLEYCCKYKSKVICLASCCFQFYLCPTAFCCCCLDRYIPTEEQEYCVRHCFNCPSKKKSLSMRR